MTELNDIITIWRSSSNETISLILIEQLFNFFIFFYVLVCPIFFVYAHILYSNNFSETKNVCYIILDLLKIEKFYI